MTYSRRHFVLGVGSAILMTSSAGRALANSQSQMGKRYVLIHDEGRCIGCDECSVACNKQNNVPSGYSRLRMVPIPKANNAEDGSEQHYFRHSCQHCDDAPCITVCPTGASYRDENGIVQVNRALCLGCDYCVSACPYKVRYINPFNHIADKCDFCSESRLSQGYMPICVRICPKNALTFGPENSELVQQLLRPDSYYVHQLKNTGKPHIYRLMSL